MNQEDSMLTATTAAAPGEDTSQTGGEIVQARKRRATLQSVALPLAWAALIIVFGIVRHGSFLTASNFESIFGTQAVLLVLALGLLVPLTTGDYDLSVAGVLTLSAMLTAVLNVQHHWPIGLAILASLLAGALVGAVNGFFVVVVGVDAFITTLGTGTFLGGIVLWLSSSETVSGVSNGLTNWVITYRLLGLPMEFWYGAVLTAVVWYVFEWTGVGRRLLFVGQNRNVSRLSGVPVARYRWLALVTSGVISAFAGVLYVGTLGAADPSSGLGLLLPAFAAAFLGATSIRPGRFNAVGTFIAVYFLSTGINGLTLIGAQSYVQDIFYGAALVIAVAASRLVRRKRI